METISINCKNDKINLVNTKWMNPFQNYPNSLVLYEQYIVRSKLYDELDELNGKKIRCFCINKNDMCHGVIISKLLKKKYRKV